MKTRRTLLALALAACAVLPVQAQVGDWPKRQPVKLVAVFPPGGSVDQVARILAQQLTQQLGQTVIVENKVGASGSIGTGAVAHATPEQCSDDKAEPADRIEACTRLIRTGKYRGEQLATVHNNRAIAYRRMNDLTRAQADYSEAIRLKPDFADYYVNRGDAFFILMRAGDRENVGEA